MKKLAIPFISLFGILSITSAAAAPNSPLTIVNNSLLQVTVKYSLCDAQKKMCSLIKEHTVSSNDHLTLLTGLKPKLDNLTIVGAVAKDSDGKQVASLNGSCDLPENANTVILDNHGTSSISCQYS